MKLRARTKNHPEDDILTSMAELTLNILGCRNAWMGPGEATSSYLARSAETQLLVDCGHGALAKLRETGDPHQLDAVWISHFHADHCADLIALGYMFKHHPHPKQGHRPQLLIPAGEGGRLAAMGRVFSDDESLFHELFNVNEVSEGEPVMVGDMILQGSWVPHACPTLALDVRLRDDEDKRFTYSADCGPNQALVALADKTPLLLIEATLPEPSDDHLSARSAGAIAAEAEAHTCILTHVCDAYEEDWVLRQGEEGFGTPPLLARSGMSIICGG